MMYEEDDIYLLKKKTHINTRYLVGADNIIFA